MLTLHANTLYSPPLTGYDFNLLSEALEKSSPSEKWVCGRMHIYCYICNNSIIFRLSRAIFLSAWPERGKGIKTYSPIDGE